MDNFDIIALKYPDIAKRFGREKIRQRYSYVYNLLYDFVNNQQHPENFIISSDLVNHVITDYFVDIARLKPFQEIEYINDIKIYAYTAFWLLRHKPIQLKVKAELDDNSIFINESVVVSMLESFLFDDIVPFCDDDKVFIDEFHENMSYFFRYRNFTAQNIEIMLLAFISGRHYQMSVDFDG